VTATLGNILESVKSGLRLFDDWGTAHTSSDGVTSRFHLPDYPIIDVENMAVLVEDEDGVLQVLDPSEYEVDAETGWFTFNTPPDLKDDGTERQIQWTWRFRIFSDTELIGLINAGVRYVGQEFYVGGSSDTTLTTDLYEYEYAAPAGAKRILSVELRTGSSQRWRETNKWRTRNVLGQLYVQFKFHPGIQEVRLNYIGRANAFSLVDREADDTADPPVEELLVADQTLLETGLPEDALDPIVHYACWQAFERRVIGRSRDDSAQHPKVETTVTMRDLESRATRLKLLFDLHYSQFVTEFPQGRIIG
jgi:hypothetical protein